MSRHAVSRLLVVLFFLFPFTLLLSPTLIAQGGEEGIPVRTVPVVMNFQPPRNANTLNEFLPPGVILHPITTTVPTTPTIPSGTVTPHVTVTPPPSGTTILPTVTTPGGTLTLPPTTPYSPEGMTLFGPPVSVMPVTYTTPILLEEDAVSFMENQIAVVVETDTFAGDTFLQFAPLETANTPFTTTLVMSQTITTTLSSYTGGYDFLHFQLEAVSATTSQPHTSLTHPARVIIDLRELTSDYDMSGYDFYLAYRDESDPHLWIDVPVIIHQSDGLISAEVTHFSEWAAGARPDKWQPNWNPPGVSEFSGAVTYSYPIQIPAGRHGLQPNVVLAYSSAGLNGRIFDTNEWLLADGWSLPDISIVREGIKYENNRLGLTRKT